MNFDIRLAESSGKRNRLTDKGKIISASKGTSERAGRITRSMILAIAVINPISVLIKEAAICAGRSSAQQMVMHHQMFIATTKKQ